MTRRMERINVLLRGEISRLIATEMQDPRLASIVSVTRIEASPDLRYARVYISVLGDAEAKAKTMKALKSAAGFLHQALRRKLPLRSAPNLTFYLDESIEQGADVLRLIREGAPTDELTESA